MTRDTISTRCFPNHFEDKDEVEGSPLQPQGDDCSGVPQLTSDARETLLEALRFYSSPLLSFGGIRLEEWCRRRCCSRREGGNPDLYVGRAGLDLALLQLRVQGVGGPLEKALNHRPWFITDKDCDIKVKPESAGDCSLLCGSAGVWFVLCIRSLELSGETTTGKERSELVRIFLRFCSYAIENADADEWLYGRTGLLLGMLLLLQSLKKHQNAGDPGLQQLYEACGKTVDIMAEVIVASGVRRAAEEGMTDGQLVYRWHGEEYLGAAHGYFGILYALLHVPSIREDLNHPAHKHIKATLNWLRGLETSNGNYPAVSENPRPSSRDPTVDPLVHFCHGAPGAVFVFAEAYQVYGASIYRNAAEIAAQCVWTYGMLRKGPCLCHGVAGNGYALLRMYQVLKEPVWLGRAVRFGEELNSLRQKKILRDHPFSLFEGHAGVCCFLSDLLYDPLKARLPLFGL